MDNLKDAADELLLQEDEDTSIPYPLKFYISGLQTDTDFNYVHIL